MSVEIIPVRSEHVPELAAICFEAFGRLQDRHGVERDFDSVHTAEMVVGLFAGRPDFAGFAAARHGKLLGSNFISFSDPVAGVGPITVHPDVQAAGVGRALMQAVLEEARRRGVSMVRLQQEAINTTSLSLYTKLGFDWRDACALIRPAAADRDDPRITQVTHEDLPEIDRLSTRLYHHTRRGEVEGFPRIGLPGVIMRRDGRVVGYYFASFIGHGFAESAADLAAMIGQCTRHAPPHFHKVLVPLSQHELHRALLAGGGRTIKLFNYMTVGEYRPPVGAWVPSIGM
mgnify:CR=1 FL=1